MVQPPKEKKAYMLYGVITTMLVLFSLIFVALCMEFLLRKGLVDNSLYQISVFRKNINTVLEETGAPQKLLIVGDSFFCPSCEVDQTLKDWFEGYRVSVLNVAFSGYSPVDYYLNVKKFGRLFQPDVVLMGYYTGNDLTDLKYRLGKDSPLESANRLVPFHTSLEKGKYFFGQYLWEWLLTHVNSRKMKKKWINEWRQGPVDENIIDLYENGALINPHRVNVGIVDPEHIRSNLLIHTPGDEATWQKIDRIIRDIHGMCQEMKAQFVIVVFPNTAQVNDQHHSLYQGMNLKMDPAFLTEKGGPQQRIVGLCDELEIDCLNMLPAYRARGQEHLYFETDDHMNHEGAQLAASLIFDFLQDTTALTTGSIVESEQMTPQQHGPTQ